MSVFTFHKKFGKEKTEIFERIKHIRNSVTSDSVTIVYLTLDFMLKTLTPDVGMVCVRSRSHCFYPLYMRLLFFPFPQYLIIFYCNFKVKIFGFVFLQMQI